MADQTPEINLLREIRERHERAQQAALMLDLANPLGTPVTKIDPLNVAAICRSADDVSDLLDIAEAAHRAVEAWALMQKPAHPDSAVPFMEMMRAVDDMDLGLNRLEGRTSLKASEEDDDK